MSILPYISTAADTTGSFVLDSRVEASDNKRLFVDGNEEGATGVVLTTTGNITSRTERNTSSVDASLQFFRFDRDSSLNSDDQTVRFNNRYLWERAAFGFRANYLRQSVLVTEIDDTGVFDTEQQDRRETIQVNPTFDVSVTERDSLTLGYYREEVRFPGSDLVNDTEFTVWSPSVSWIHNFENERAALISSVFYSDFDAQDFDNTTKTYGGNAGFIYQFSERLSSRFTLGYRSSRFENNRFGGGQEGTESGALFELGLDKNYGNGAWGIRVNRSITPSASGVVFERNELGYTQKHHWQHNFYSEVNLQWFRNESVDSDASGSDREFISAHVGLGLQLSPQMSLSGRYVYREQDFIDSSNEASSNTVYFGLTYRTNPKTFF